MSTYLAFYYYTVLLYDFNNYLSNNMLLKYMYLNKISLFGLQYLLSYHPNEQPHFIFIY